jgi:transcriptional regulator with XRE-family HTH domain
LLVNGERSFRRTIVAPMSYGDDVRTARKQLKLTQDEAAELAGVSRRYYLEIEHGRANVSVELLQRVANALGVRDLQLGDMRAHFGAPAVVRSIVGMIGRAEALLREAREAMQGGARDFAKLVDDLKDDLKNVAAVPASEPLVSEALFRAVDFTYPSVARDHVLRAEVLGAGMVAFLAPGDTIHIDTSVRTPHPGVVLAVHSSLIGSALGRVPPTGERVLLREQADAVLIGTGTCVIFGAVEKVV